MKRKYLVLLMVFGVSACDVAEVNQSTIPENDGAHQANPEAVLNPDIPIKMDLPIYLHGVDSLFILWWSLRSMNTQIKAGHFPKPKYTAWYQSLIINCMAICLILFLKINKQDKLHHYSKTIHK